MWDISRNNTRQKGTTHSTFCYFPRINGKTSQTRIKYHHFYIEKKKKSTPTFYFHTITTTTKIPTNPKHNLMSTYAFSTSTITWTFRKISAMNIASPRNLSWSAGLPFFSSSRRLYSFWHLQFDFCRKWSVYHLSCWTFILKQIFYKS